MENKKQHYVPQFYLRNFGLDHHKGSINLCLKKDGKIIENAEIRNQAYKNYFYGQDQELEKEFAKFEDIVSKIIRQIIGNKKITQSASELLWIRYFTFFQYQRTLKQADDTNDFINSTIHSIADRDDSIKDKVKDLVFGYDKPILFSLKILQKILPETLDLAVKIVINNSKWPFLTSDHPVVLYNQFLERKGKQGGHTGLKTKGLQVFFPLSPRVLLMYYDRNVYDVGAKNKLDTTTSQYDDIRQLNMLQTINCGNVFFFNNELDKKYINSIRNGGLKHSYYGTEHQAESKPKMNADGTESFILHTYHEPLKLGLTLSFVKETLHAKNYKLTNWAVEIRDESWRNSQNIVDFIPKNTTLD